MKQSSRTTVKQILAKKAQQEKITMLTAYDYPLALLVDKAGIDIVLVGDSLANVVLGLNSTREVGMEEMIHHSKAANRAVKKAMLIGDMPFGSYQTKALAVKNAKRFIKEAGCDAVKIEWFDRCAGVAEAIVKAGIPLMGHVGLTPQAFKNPKDFKVQGVEAAAAKTIIQNAKALEKKGCFSIVLECIPDKIAEIITNTLSIPTIGIGAGIHCDGQVLVTYDVLGLFDRFKPKFAKQYVNLNAVIFEAIQNYRKDVVQGTFPGEEHRFTMRSEEMDQLK